LKLRPNCNSPDGSHGHHSSASYLQQITGKETVTYLGKQMFEAWKQAQTQQAAMPFGKGKPWNDGKETYP
jgi:hypothetical protein